MKQLLDRLMKPLKACNPNEGEDWKQRYAPFAMMLASAGVIVAERLGYTLGKAELEPFAFLLLLVAGYIVRHYEDDD